MMFWLQLRKPLVEPNARQRACAADSIPHVWHGFPLTRFMSCGSCHYRPYAAPVQRTPAPTRDFAKDPPPMGGWRE